MAVVLVNFNGAEVTLPCIDSLRRSTWKSWFAVIVDNGSSDDSAARLADACGPPVRAESPQQSPPPDGAAIWFATGENLGFSGGNNAGIRHALAAGARSVLLLNNDTLVQPDTLEQMVRRLASSQRIGAVTPLIAFQEPADRVWSAGGHYSLWIGKARHDGWHLRVDDPTLAQPRLCTFGTGCALLLRRETLDRVGGFDDDLFLYNEDVDLSLRIASAGWQIAYEPTARIIHCEAWSTRKASNQFRRVHAITRNLLLVHRKHRRWYHAPTFWAWFLLRQCLGAALLGGLRRRETETLRGVWSGIRAYFAGERGRPAVYPKLADSPVRKP